MGSKVADLRTSRTSQQGAEIVSEYETIVAFDCLMPCEIFKGSFLACRTLGFRAEGEVYASGHVSERFRCNLTLESQIRFRHQDRKPLIFLVKLYLS